MKTLKTVVVAQKKPPMEIVKKRKAENIAKKKDKKYSSAPKRPPTAFFVFMEGFRKMFKEKFPDIKSASAVVKAGGEKWKSMSDAEKTPIAERAAKMKAEYAKALKAYTEKLDNGFGGTISAEESGTSTAEVSDEGDQEASSQVRAASKPSNTSIIVVELCSKVEAQ